MRQPANASEGERAETVLFAVSVRSTAGVGRHYFTAAGQTQTHLKSQMMSHIISIPTWMQGLLKSHRYEIDRRVILHFELEHGSNLSTLHLGSEIYTEYRICPRIPICDERRRDCAVVNNLKGVVCQIRIIDHYAVIIWLTGECAGTEAELQRGSV